tara:strand:+ start:29545 stop:29685 length:141 start_codon:yes stop_codon:yes gene_type:complete
MAAFHEWMLLVLQQTLCHGQVIDYQRENNLIGEIYPGGIGFKKPYG